MPAFAHATTAELVAALDSANGWQRDTIARLLFQRQDPSSVSMLRSLLTSSKSPAARVRVLHLLDGLQSLSPADLVNALSDPDPHVREHGVLLSERLLGSPDCPAELWEKIASLTDDPSIAVRYQLAFSLGEARPARTELLARIARRDKRRSPDAGGDIQLCRRQGRGAILIARPARIGASQGGWQAHFWSSWQRSSDSTIANRTSSRSSESHRTAPNQANLSTAFALAGAVRDGVRTIAGKTPANFPHSRIFCRAPHPPLLIRTPMKPRESRGFAWSAPLPTGRLRPALLPLIDSAPTATDPARGDCRARSLCRRQARLRAAVAPSRPLAARAQRCV